MKITLVISTLSSGGAERVLVLLAKGLLKLGHEITVITIYGQELDFYSLPKGARRKSLNLGGASGGLRQAILNNFRLIIGLRAAILNSKPDAVISFIDRTNIIAIMSMLKTGIPVVVTEHNDPATMPIGNAWSKLRRITYPIAHKVVSVSKGVDKYFASWMHPSKREVIYNPIDLEELDNRQGELISLATVNTVMSMGRLIPEKGFDILIKAFAIVKKKYPEIKLVILGEGTERSNLEQLVKEQGLQTDVLLPGRLKNPFPTLKQAAFFVSSSRSEGFGNVIVEAMALEIPVIATSCPGGSKELIIDGENGLLVEPENVNALAEAMEKLFLDKELCKILKRNGISSVSRFYLENIILEWDRLLKEVT